MAVYDFATLPIPAPFKRSLATLFAARCGPSGTWASVKTSDSAWWAVRPFALFLGAYGGVPQDVDEMTVALWSAWRLTLAPRPFDYTKYATVAGLLRQDLRLSPAVREAMGKRFAWSTSGEPAYLPDEFRAVRLAARRTFRSALLRIRENSARLDAWRLSPVGADHLERLMGEALEVLARTGDVPQLPLKNGAMRLTYRYRAALGGTGSAHTWKRLFLSRQETGALAVLLAAEFGLNATTISELPVPTVVPGSGEGADRIYRLALEKRRRGVRGRFESRNVADTGADSAGRLLSEALEATVHARRVVSVLEPGIDRLLTWHETTPHEGRDHPGAVRVGPFGFGADERGAKDWARSVGLHGSPMRRIRKTVNVLYRREPGQNSQDTHDSVYVLPEPQVRQAAVPVIAEGAMDAWRAARRTVFQARLTAQPGGELQTATAGCADYENSPFTPAGHSCAASFLLCTACPNARVTPAHHPRLAHLHRALENLHSVVDPAVWDADWAEAHTRLADLRSRLGTAVWDAALSDVTTQDRATIDQLLNGEYDL
ncbi:hypothetical protein HET69_07845 [Streptomyces sp. CJ_13]|uniref:hypothetical protein n=1 Tax=Streptomyces sp. CJ_13 TaxID=2724943 RepID=UPI001BDBF530|nr:hypothetical protein [Streptomyces sp. CJ_13]MBT1183929.1 hypothetical protein [Streptomyces sp. CJ_13]